MNIERIVTQTANLKNNVAETIAKEAGETIKQAAESKITKAAALGIVASATGVMLANNAKDSTKENIKELKSLGLSDEVVGKMLSLKNSKNKPVFNSEAIKLLKETAEAEDKTFFNYAMKNVDYIRRLDKTYVDNKNKKGFEEQYVAKYSLVANTPEGRKKAQAFVDKDNKVREVRFEEQNKDGTTLNKAKYIDFSEKDRWMIDYDWKEFQYLEKDGEVVSRETFGKPKGGDYITKSEYNLDDKKFKHPILVKQTSITPNGVIDDVTESKFNYDSKGETITFSRVATNYKNNGEKTLVNGVGKYGEVKNYERTVKNHITGKSEVQKIQLSGVPGVYNSVIIDENGNEKVESLGRVNPDGSTYVEKNLESLDGVKTHYIREASKNEDDIKTFYQITDKDGKVLTTVDRTFKRISPTKTYSSINGHGYSVEKQEKAYVVTDLASQKTYTIRHKDLFKNNETRKHPELIDKLSGDMLIDIVNENYKYKYTDSPTKGLARLVYRYIISSPDLSCFAHEQGHFKDGKPDFVADKMVYRISTNPLFREEYEKERKQFMEAFPGVERTFIKYFIDRVDHYNKEEGGPIETIAETNAIYSTASGESLTAMRTHYLQKYFPRSIAAASYLLNPNSNLYIENS